MIESESERNEKKEINRQREKDGKIPRKLCRFCEIKIIPEIDCN